MKTQKDKVLGYMQTHSVITTRDAGIKLEIWDLQSIIRDLKNDGLKIFSEFVTNKRTKKTYKIYALTQKSIDGYKRLYA